MNGLPIIAFLYLRSYDCVFLYPCLPVERGGSSWSWGVAVSPGDFEDAIVSGVVREGEETTAGTEVLDVEVVTTEAVVGVDKEEVTTGALEGPSLQKVM